MCAVRNCGGALQYAGWELSKNFGIAVVACEQDGNALQFVSRELKNDTVVFTQKMITNILVFPNFYKNKLKKLSIFCFLSSCLFLACVDGCGI